MSRNSTFNLTIHNFSSVADYRIKSKDEIFAFDKEFKDVFDVLDTLDVDVRQEIVDSILQRSSTL